MMGKVTSWQCWWGITMRLRDVNQLPGVRWKRKDGWIWLLSLTKGIHHISFSLLLLFMCVCVSLTLTWRSSFKKNIYICPWTEQIHCSINRDALFRNDTHLFLFSYHYLFSTLAPFLFFVLIERARERETMASFSCCILFSFLLFPFFSLSISLSFSLELKILPASGYIYI